MNSSPQKKPKLSKKCYAIDCDEEVHTYDIVFYDDVQDAILTKIFFFCYYHEFIGVYNHLKYQRTNM